MKLIIDIDDRYYELVKRKVNLKQWEYIHIPSILIANGTPLPKEHGDLIDRSTLEPDTEWSDWDDGWISYSYRQIADADVVIKADGGGEE